MSRAPSLCLEWHMPRTRMIEGNFTSRQPGVGATDVCLEYHDKLVCRDSASCKECLMKHCEWANDDECGLGWEGGFAASVPPFTCAADEEAAAERACNEYQNYLANEEVCHEISSCEECIATEFVGGDGFCLWFEDHDGWCASRIYHPFQVSVLECGSSSKGYLESTLSTFSVFLFYGLLLHYLL